MNVKRRSEGCGEERRRMGSEGDCPRNVGEVECEVGYRGYRE